MQSSLDNLSQDLSYSGLVLLTTYFSREYGIELVARVIDYILYYSLLERAGAAIVRAMTGICTTLQVGVTNRVTALVRRS